MSDATSRSACALLALRTSAGQHIDLLQLVERLALPFVTSPHARGFLPDAHALCCNAVQWAAQAEADLIVVLGARLNWTFRYAAHVNRSAKLVQIDVDPV